MRDGNLGEGEGEAEGVGAGRKMLSLSGNGRPCWKQIFNHFIFRMVMLFLPKKMSH